MISRRTFGKLALGSLPLAASWAGYESPRDDQTKIDSTIHGVRIGVSGYSFQNFSLDAAIETMKSIGLGSTEVWFRHIEPKTTREELRAWRLSVPLDEFRKIGKKYDDAGIDKVAFTHDMKDDFTDEELERPFLMAKALGTPRIAMSTTLTVARRLVPLMETYNMEVAFHGHINVADPNEFAGPDSFRKALAMSPLARINLDIGQFVGAGFDPVPFIAEQHAKIPVLHIRDGKRGQRGKVPWGTGDVPIKDVLQLLRREKYAMVADIEYDYGGAMDPMNEIRKCFDFCKNALE
jgi:sugar phosphate isomerase/epimerase